MKRFGPTALTVVGLVLAAIVLLAINMFAEAAFRGARLDLTHDRLYTVSKATKQVLREIAEPVTLRFYYTKQLGDRSPAIQAYAQRVEELLDQYERIAGGKIRLEKYHPEPFSDEEDNAVSAGLRGVPYTAEGDLGFFGLEGRNSTDDQRLIQFFSPERERFLEYDLTQMVYGLANPQRKVLGIMSKLPIEGMGQLPGPFGEQAMPAWAVYNQLKDLFDIRMIGTAADHIADDIDVLMVVHPRNLPDHTVYAIEQYILKGGKAMIFVDPYSELEGSQRSPGSPPPLGNSEIFLDSLYGAWGVEVVPGMVAGDIENAARVDLGAGKRGSITQYVAWLNLTRRNFNPDDVATANLETMNFGTAGIIRKKEGSSATVVPLVVTSNASEEIDVNRVRFQPDPVKLLNEFKSSGEPLVLAARVTGSFRSAFPDGPPPRAKPQNVDEETFKAEEEARKKAHVARSNGAVSFVLVADTDMLSDPLWIATQSIGDASAQIPVADNGSFVANLAETLAGRQDLIGLRTRGTSIRPFHLIEQLEREAEQRFRAKEQALAQKLRDTQKKLEELQSQGLDGGGEQILTQEQREMLDKLRQEILTTRKELRGVQADLRRDVNQVNAIAKVANIVAVPVLIALVAIVLAVVRRIRRARRAALAE